jgi:hypothetical protein
MIWAGKKCVKLAVSPSAPPQKRGLLPNIRLRLQGGTIPIGQPLYVRLTIAAGQLVLPAETLSL